MGKRGGKKVGFGRGRGGGGGGVQRSRGNDHEEMIKSNDEYERYYNELGIVDEQDRETFWAALRRELPNSFRFTGSKGHALQVQQRLRDHYIPEITAIHHNGELVQPPTPISWYPDELAWQMTTPKNVVRKFPPFSSFQKFLVSETSVGNISRQEAVSMIPPLILDVKPGMTVLDLCAAPGSKAAQLIEMVHAGEEHRVQKVLDTIRAENHEISREEPTQAEQVDEQGVDADDHADDGRATGLLIANDMDYKRAHLLIHQMKRLNSPNLLVSNHDATLYPSIKLPPDPAAGPAKATRYLKFDRILADVPCSGDGTGRKNYRIWKEWNPNNALGLFPTQVRILVRALQMLKVGGTVVYSTCSMNPVENEAVVASAIARCGGSSKVGIIDCSAKLPLLKRSAGLTRWKVMDKQGHIWGNWQEVEKRRAEYGPDGLGKLVEAMFTPVETEDRIPLERCIRVYAHQQDTGAFFITALEKKAEIKARPEKSLKSHEVNGAPPPEEVLAQATEEDSTILPATDLESSSSATVPLDSAIVETKPPLKRDLDTEVIQTSKKAKVFADQNHNQIKSLNDHQDDPTADHHPADALFSHPPNQASLSSDYTKKKATQTYEEPFKYLDPGHEVLEEISKFYQLDSRFPRDRFMVRNASSHPAKTIYYTSQFARDVLTENEGKGLRFVHCGVKMFVKQDVQSVDVCRWRIQAEGLPILEAWVGDERVVRLDQRETLRSLLIEMFPKVTDMGWTKLAEIGERVRDITMGCCVLRIEAGAGVNSFSERMVLPIWRSLHSLNLMLPKEDRKAMLLRIFNDDSPLQDHSKDRLNGPPKDHIAPENLPFEDDLMEAGVESTKLEDVQAEVVMEESINEAGVEDAVLDIEDPSHHIGKELETIDPTLDEAER